MAGSGAKYGGVWAVAVSEGHTVDLKACMMERPPRIPKRRTATSATTPLASGSVLPDQTQEHEEGEADEEPDNTIEDDNDNRNGDDDGNYDDDTVYRDHEGARWCWPFMSGDSAAHVAGFGKSLIWELARAELDPGSSSGPTSGAGAGGAMYRGAEGVNTVY